MQGVDLLTILSSLNDNRVLELVGWAEKWRLKEVGALHFIENEIRRKLTPKVICATGVPSDSKRTLISGEEEKGPGAAGM